MRVKGGAFPVDIDENKLVGHLKEEIKARNPNRIKCAASKLQLFLAKNGNGWLNGAGADSVKHPQDFEKMDPTLSIKNEIYFGESFKRNEGEVRVLVALPGAFSEMKCAPDSELVQEKLKLMKFETFPANMWFPDTIKKTIVDCTDEEDGATSCEVHYVKMVDFPPLAHIEQDRSGIMERACYRVMLTERINKTKEYLGKANAILIAKGNLGVGKRHFYLYCAFRLIRGLVDVALPKYALVLNFGKSYLRYFPKDRMICEMEHVELAK